MRDEENTNQKDQTEEIMETFSEFLQTRIDSPIKLFLKGGHRFDVKIKSVDGNLIKAVETTASKEQPPNRIILLDSIVAVIF